MTKPGDDNKNVAAIANIPSREMAEAIYDVLIANGIEGVELGEFSENNYTVSYWTDGSGRASELINTVWPRTLSHDESLRRWKASHHD